MWLTSLSRRLCNLMNQDPMKKVNIVHPPCLLSLVFILHTSIFTALRLMTGAHAVTLRALPSATVSASGLWLAAALLASMYLNQGTSNSATARCQLMLLSAMVPISTFWNGFTSTTEDTGDWMVSCPSGFASPTGCSPSTSEHLVYHQPTGRDISFVKCLTSKFALRLCVYLGVKGLLKTQWSQHWAEDAVSHLQLPLTLSWVRHYLKFFLH